MPARAASVAVRRHPDVSAPREGPAPSRVDQHKCDWNGYGSSLTTRLKDLRQRDGLDDRRLRVLEDRAQ